MDNLRILVHQYLRAAWRRRWTGVIFAWLICGLGWVGVYLIPNQFESSARLYVDADAVLTPLLRGIAADTEPTSQLEILQRTLLSRPNMEKLISKTDLDLTINSPADRERLITHLANTIRVVPQTRNLFTITYRDKDPKMAYDVVQTLLTIFMESATGTNRADMDNARLFLQHQIASYEQQLRAAEKRRAEFRSRYIDILPDAANPGVPALQVARNNVAALEGKLQDLTMERDALKDEVAKTPPMLVAETAAQQAGGDQQSRLHQAQEQLRMLLLKDTDKHPDVIAQRKLIASLKSAPPDTSSADAGPSKRSVPNPVYDSLKVKLIDIETQVGAVQRQHTAAVAYRDKLEKIQEEQPGLMAEYENQDRDYTVLRGSYEALLARLQSANIGQAADTQADKVKLQIVDPPVIPRLPAAPNRLLLVTGVLLVGCGAGMGITVLFGQFDSSFSTADDLRSLGLPVLGGISTLGLASFRQRLTGVAQVVVAVVLLVGIYGGLMVHILRSSALI